MNNKDKIQTKVNDEEKDEVLTDPGVVVEIIKRLEKGEESA